MRASFEQLESRQLLASATASVVAGVLTVQGSDQADEIHLSSSAGVTTVDINGDDSTFNDSDYTGISISGGNGNDLILLDTTITASAYISGDAGNDTLTGGAGNDSLVGGDGNDTSDYSMETADLGSSIGIFVVSPDRGSDLIKTETLLAGSGNDRFSFIVTDSGPGTLKYVDMGPGNDSITLYADGGIVHGGDGNDSILIVGSNGATYYGDAGDDTLWFQRSSSTARDFHGGDGIDTVNYTGGYNHGKLHVTIDDLPGDGTVNSEYANNLKDNVHTDVEIVICADGNDTIIGSSNNETIIGGGGNDLLIGNGGTDSLDGGVGKNVLLATPPAHVPGNLLNIVGTAGDDQILIRRDPVDSTYLDVVINGAASSYYFADVGFIQIDGKAGNDLVQFDQTGVSPLAFRSKLLGGAGNDTIYGSAGADQIHGGDGNDYLSAGAGNDAVYGDAGNDKLYGGDGNDYLDGGAGADMLRGDAGIDRIIATTGQDDYAKNKGDLISLV